MIKLKDILIEAKSPSIFVPRRTEDRLDRLIRNYIRGGTSGDLNLGGFGLTKLPDILKDIVVGGFFNCGGNKLTSLENCPPIIGAGFNCSNNKLTSLEGGPDTVRGNYFCINNNLTNLKGAPKKIYGDFFCSINRLKSLEGAPQQINGDFIGWSQKNKKVFTEEYVRSVCDVKGDVFVA